ncbi:unnamed protein product, partial [Laminaria digitata]
GGERPPFLSFTGGGVSGFLPDVHWAVRMQHKRFLKMEDSGSVRVTLKGIALSVSLDPGAGAGSLSPFSATMSSLRPPTPTPT